MKTTSPINHSRKAFTLVELLTVIAIIGILAGITIPVTLRVRNSARDVQCRNNLRTLANAHALYRQDFGGNSPCGDVVPADHPLREGTNTYTPFHLLRYYYRPNARVFGGSPLAFIKDPMEICPMGIPTNTSKNATDPGRDGDYGMLNRSEGKIGTGQTATYPMANLKFDTYYTNPARTPLFWDAWSGNTTTVPPRHGGLKGINVSFIDGHSAFIRRDDPRLFRNWWNSARNDPEPDNAQLGKGSSIVSENRPDS